MMRRLRRLGSSRFFERYSIFIALVVMFAICPLFNVRFLLPKNLSNVIKQASVGAIIAYGEMLLIIGAACRIFRRNRRWPTRVCFQSASIKAPVR